MLRSKVFLLSIFAAGFCFAIPSFGDDGTSVITNALADLPLATSEALTPAPAQTNRPYHGGVGRVGGVRYGGGYHRPGGAVYRGYSRPYGTHYGSYGSRFYGGHYHYSPSRSYRGYGYGYHRGYGYGSYRRAYYRGGYPYYYPWYYYPSYYSDYGYTSSYPDYYSTYSPDYSSDYSAVPYAGYPYSTPSYTPVSYPVTTVSSGTRYICSAADTAATETHIGRLGEVGHFGSEWTLNITVAQNQALAACAAFHASCKLTRCYTSAGVRSSGSVNITVYVPEDATVYFDDKLTGQGGAERNFTYPGELLEEGQAYTYTVRASVVRDGEVQTQTRALDFTSGQALTVAFDFAQPDEDGEDHPTDVTEDDENLH